MRSLIPESRACAARSCCDALIIGGGHNGLVCAAYLAAAGLKVTVLERRAVVGGAAVTEEFHPGFRNSVAATPSRCSIPKSSAIWNSPSHGLRVVERKLANFLPTEDGALSEDRRRATPKRKWRNSLQRMPRGWTPTGQRLDAVADVLRDLVLETPPNVVAGSWRSALPELLQRRAPRRTPAQAQHDACVEAPGSVRQLGRRLSRWLVRERADQGGVRLRRHRRQLCESLHAGLGLCAAASRVWRGERQERRLGPRHRRHGRDHAGDGKSATARGVDIRICHSGARSHRRRRPRGGRHDGCGRHAACAPPSSPI